MSKDRIRTSGVGGVNCLSVFQTIQTFNRSSRICKDPERDRKHYSSAEMSEETCECVLTRAVCEVHARCKVLLGKPIVTRLNESYSVLLHHHKNLT